MRFPYYYTFSNKITKVKIITTYTSIPLIKKSKQVYKKSRVEGTEWLTD